MSDGLSDLTSGAEGCGYIMMLIFLAGVGIFLYIQAFGEKDATPALVLGAIALLALFLWSFAGEHRGHRDG